MSCSKTKWCDCCGAEIPYNSNRSHSEYEGHVANCMSYVAEDEGNKDFNWTARKGDRIFGLVDIHMHRNSNSNMYTVVPNNVDGDRCKDICNNCKIKFLENTIAYLKKHE